MGTTIITKNGSGAPAASDLVAGELAVDLTNKRLYSEDSGGTVIEVGSNPSTIVVAGTSTLTGNVTASSDVSVGGNLTVTGNATIEGNLTFGNAATDTITLGADVASHILPSADDTYDLGATASRWRDIYIDGTAYLDAINFNGTAITATAAELNILDGVTSTAAELNILDGVTSTAAELNILDGVTSTTDELNILDGVTSTAAELNLVDGSSAGTIVNSKAVVYGASGEVNATTLQIAGTSITSTAAELNILDGVTATAAELNILDGVTSTAAELNILDGVTSTAAELNLLDGVTATTAELNYLDVTTLGTVEASKAVTADANADVLFGDNDKAIFGAGPELQIYSDGTSGIIKDVGAGNIKILADDFYVQNAAGTSTLISALDNGKVGLGFNGSEKLATTSGGIQVTGDISNASGDLTLDVAGDIVLDADGGDVLFADGGTTIGFIGNSSSDLVLKSQVQDKDLLLKGNDGGSTITALQLDMSQAGRATFNEGIVLKSSSAGDFGVNINTSSGDSMKLQVVDTGTAGAADGKITVSDGDFQVDASGDIVLDAGGAQIRFYDDGTDIGVFSNESGNFVIKPQVSDADLIIKGNDDGSTITALTLDMSDAGAATFNSDIYVPTKIIHTGDTDTYLEFSAADTWRVVAGNEERFKVASGEVTVNESSQDTDFRVESDNNANMLFVDAGNDRVGVGVGSPAATLDVDGTIKLDGNYPTGTENVALGNTALDSVTSSGNYNTAIGANALTANTDGGTNTAVGSRALDANTTGGSNSAVGQGALSTNETGSNNSAFGQGALSVVTGSSNLGLGAGAGNLLTTGSNNVIIGNYDGNEGGLDIRTGSNNIVLSDGAGNIRQYIDSSGQVGIGLINPGVRLHVKGATDSNVMIVDATGTAPNYIFDVRDDGNTKFRVLPDGEVLLTNNDAGAGVGPYLTLFRDSASPADNDQIGQIRFQGEDSAGGATDYTRIVNQIIDTTNGTEDGRMSLNTVVGGSMLGRLNLIPGEAVFNDESADIDFRVESDANSHAIFLDAGQDVVSIGSSTINGAFVDNQYVGLQIGTPGTDNFGGHMFMGQTAVTDTWMDIVAVHDDGATGVYFTIHGVRTGDQNRSYVAFVRYAYNDTFNLITVSQQNTTVEYRVSGNVLQYRFTSAGPYFVTLSVMTAG